MDQDYAGIITRAVAGNQDALRILLEHYGPIVARQIDGRIGRRWRGLLEADDVMQVTYLEAFLQIDRIVGRTGSAFEAWIATMADHNLRDAIRDLSAKKRPNPARRIASVFGGDSSLALLDLLGATSSTPSQHAVREEYGRTLDSALAKLPEDYRSVVKLYDLENKSVEDVASAMKRSVGAIYMLRMRAHGRLRNLLGSASDFFSDCA
ncbi:MAG: sigma-70 family RNA polymerase sigma factor [Planctomycetes bacterium]|nr:sigma-70 family RNA polymerase sigma factor [Planctomycetota bacterium]